MAFSSKVRVAPSRLLMVVFAVLGVVGAFTTWAGIDIFRSTGPDAAIGPLILGIALMGIGTAGWFFVRFASRTAGQTTRLQAAHPGKPWAWREDWASGRVAGNGRSGALGLVLFAFVWNGFTWPVAWLFLTKEDVSGGAEYLVLLFPGVGVLLLVLALRALLQSRKYGRSFFVLETNPGAIGRSLQGFVETTLEAVPPDGIEVRLRCERRRRSRRGKNRSTQTTTLWQDHVTVEPLELTRGIGGIRIPVSFELPADVLPHNDADPYDTRRDRCSTRHRLWRQLRRPCLPHGRSCVHGRGTRGVPQPTPSPGALPRARRATLQPDEDIRAEVVGEGSAQSWEVTVATSSGKSYGAAAHFTSQRDADWVAEQIRAAIKGVV